MEKEIIRILNMFRLKCYSIEEAKKEFLVLYKNYNPQLKDIDMNLVQTVSAIVGKEVDIKFAMDFAINQFGVLSTYLKLPQSFTYVMVGSEESTLDYPKMKLVDWLECYHGDYEVGKYADNLLDKSLLKKIEDYGSFIFITVEEFDTLK